MLAIETGAPLLQDLVDQRGSAGSDQGRGGSAGRAAVADASRLVVAGQPEVHQEVGHQRDLEPPSSPRLLPGVDLELVESGFRRRVDQEHDLLRGLSLGYEWQK